MAELLLEILSEEIPARLQLRGVEDLKSLVCTKLKDQDLSFDSVLAHVGPRRLVLVVDGLPEYQRDRIEERKGPRSNAPKKAILGFLQSVGYGSLDHQNIEKRKIKGAEFYFLKRSVNGRATRDILPSLIRESITELRWPKSMRWGSGNLRWVRPIHSILCLFDGHSVKGSLTINPNTSNNVETVISFNNKTRGHRFMAPESFTVKGFEDYQTKLRNAFVIVESEERRQLIAQKTKALARKQGLCSLGDKRLLNENVGLVEWPVVLGGSFDEAFLSLPEEVLVTSMKSHQKYFPLYQANGLLAPRFVMVSNLAIDDGGATIVAGNERVLRARLYDAKFFWDSDRQVSLADHAKRLGEITFHARLGSVSDKVKRLAKLSSRIAQSVPKADAGLVNRAALLCKADLVTEMVGEFPELQGVMGRHYALHHGEDEMVADAIVEHYAPSGPSDVCPSAPNSVSLALADKIDVLVGMFGIGERPTGSKDPYALRRAALGVIRLIMENDLRLPLIEVVAVARESYKEGLLVDPQGSAASLIDFISDRLKVHLRDLGYGHDVVSAAFAVAEEDDLWRLVARVEALKDFLASSAGADLLSAYTRASNIVRIEERADGVTYSVDAKPELLVQSEEKMLFAHLISFREKVNRALKEEDFAAVMGATADLRTPVDAFFDQVTVNCKDRALRQNRLCLLGQIRDSLKSVADFSLIKG